MVNCNLETDTSFGFEEDQIPSLKEIDGPGPRQWWKLREEFTFQLKIAPGILVWNITIPKGFETDLASIPRLFWRIFPPLGKYNRAALIHDYLYSILECSSFLADTIFREAMAQLKVPVWKRVVMYYVVRVYSVLGFRHRRLKMSSRKQRVRDRRKLGVNFFSVMRATRELLEHPMFDPEDFVALEPEALAPSVLEMILHEDLPQAMLDLPKVDWDAILAFIEKILPIILKLLALF